MTENEKLEQASAEDTHSVRATSDAYWTTGCGADILKRDREIMAKARAERKR